jgi:hypothetical protein
LAINDTAAYTADCPSDSSRTTTTSVRGEDRCDERSAVSVTDQL